MSSGAPDPLAVLDGIELALVPAAIARLAARVMTTATEPADELLTVDEAARLLKTNRRWIYKNSSRLGAVKLGRRTLRLSRQRVERWARK